MTGPTPTERARAVAVWLWPQNAGPLPAITVKNTRRGWGSHKKRTVTLPAWLFVAERPSIEKLGETDANRDEFIVYYIAHELCHVLCPLRGHNASFEAQLHAMLGDDLYAFERFYKPRAYAREMARAARFNQMEAA